MLTTNEVEVRTVGDLMEVLQKFSPDDEITNLCGEEVIVNAYRKLDGSVYIEID